MLKVVQPKTVGIMPQELKEEDEQILQKQQPVQKQYIHEVTPNDTLDRICLIYNKSKDEIRRANDFTGDEIFFKK